MIRRFARSHPGGLAVTAIATVCAVVITFPAPFPGHVVSSNDVIRQATPYATQGGPVDAIRLKNSLAVDPAEVFRPDLYWARTQVRHGHLPIWDPLVYSGWPLLASSQTAALFPVKFLSYVMPYEASIGVEIVVLLVLATLGAYLFARVLGLPRVPSTVAGLAYGFSAPMILWSLHPHSDVHAMLPWMMLGAEGALAARSWGIPALGAAVALAALGGHPESLLLDGLLVVAWVVFRLAQRVPWRERALRAARIGGGVLLGFAASAIALLPLLELLHQSPVRQRGGFPGADLKALWSLATPDVWGRPDWLFMVNPPALSNYVERTIYVGAAPVLIGAIGLLLYRDAKRWFFLVAGIASLFIAYRVPGVSPWLVKRWPLRLANAGREISVMAFCLAMLGGLGVEAVLARPGALRRPLVAATGLVLAAIPLVWLLADFHPRVGLRGALGWLPGVKDPIDQYQAAAAAGLRWAIFAGATIAALAVLHLRGGRIPSFAIVAVLALDLALGWHGYEPVMSTSQARLPLTPSLATLRAHQGHQRVVAGSALTGGQPLVPNAGEYFGLRDARGRGLPTLKRTLDAWTALGGIGGAGFAAVDPGDPKARAVRAFGVQAILTHRGAPAPPDSRKLYSGIDGDVYAIDHTTPRAFVACRWRPTSYDDAVGALQTATASQLEQDPLVEKASGPAASCTTAARAARIVRDDPTRVTIDVSGLGPGRLVLLDAYYPGWKATVDGRRVSIQPADVAFRSVTLPPGARTVEFRYQPASVRDGIVLSAIAWVVILAGGVWAVRSAAGRRRALG